MYVGYHGKQYGDKVVLEVVEEYGMEQRLKTAPVCDRDIQHTI